MMHFRFTIGRGMIFVAMMALGMSFLSMQSGHLAVGLVDLAYFLDLTAIIATIAMRGQARSMCAGYVVFASGYLVAVLATFEPYSSQHSLLLTDYTIDAARRWWGMPISDIKSLFLTAHSIFDIAAGLGGAILSRSLSSKFNDSDSPSTSRTGTS